MCVCVCVCVCCGGGDTFARMQRLVIPNMDMYCSFLELLCAHVSVYVTFDLATGLKMEGLFRVPGPAAYTEDLRKAFEEGVCLSWCIAC